MLSQTRRVVVGVFLALVVSAGPAAAECAWVLWVKHEDWISTDIEALDVGAWEPRLAYKTLNDCEEGRLQEQSSDERIVAQRRCLPFTVEPLGRKRPGVVTAVLCLPDTVDPRSKAAR